VGLGLCVLSFSLAAAPEHFAIDPAHTATTFEVSRFGISALRGHFQNVTGSISIDRESHTGSIAIEIDATTVGIGTLWFDPELKGEDFFDITRHPRLWYHADRLEFEGERPVRATGELTLRGVSNPVVLELRHFGCSRKEPASRTTCGAEIFGRISRSAFGMRSYTGFIGDEVRLMIQVEAVRQVH
jgi:polyisoprenoid-binding protein YceI